MIKDVIMKLNLTTSFSHCNHLHEVKNQQFYTKLCTHRDSKIDCATRTQRVESLETCGITDKAACLSKVTELCSLFLHVFMELIKYKYMYNTHNISCDDVIHLQKQLETPND